MSKKVNMQWKDKIEENGSMLTLKILYYSYLITE